MGARIDCSTKQETTIPDFQPAPKVPPFVTRYQFLAAIRASGRAAALKTHIQGLTEAQQEQWTHRRLIFRNSPIVTAAASALGVANGAVDNLFIAASQIED